MLAVVWPFGAPVRFADTGGAQTRYAQTVRAFLPVSAALLGHTTRPEEPVETMSSLLMADQLVLLRQDPLNTKSVRPQGRTAGVGIFRERQIKEKAGNTFLEELRRKQSDYSNTDS